MVYDYKCVNIQCPNRNEHITIKKPMDKAGDTENCKVCGESLKRIFGSPSVKTGDGYKQ
jgi:predicted nucleic acid-binding Zn ribbon protein